MFSALTYLLAFSLGLVFGSFGNVLISRRGLHASAEGRSRCPQCGSSLSVRDLVPIVSYLSLRGTCRYCPFQIPFRYPLVELTVGVLFLLSFLSASTIPEAALFAGISFLCVVLTVCDWETKTVPDSFILLLYLFSIIWLIVFSPDISQSLISGLALSAPFFLFWAVSLGRAMGVGDGLVALPFGLLLGGYGEALTAFFFSFWVGLLFIIVRAVVRVLQKKKAFTRKEAVPFLPFLCTAFLIVLFTGAVLPFWFL